MTVICGKQSGLVNGMGGLPWLLAPSLDLERLSTSQVRQRPTRRIIPAVGDEVSVFSRLYAAVRLRPLFLSKFQPTLWVVAPRRP